MEYSIICTDKGYSWVIEKDNKPFKKWVFEWGVFVDLSQHIEPEISDKEIVIFSKLQEKILNDKFEI